MTSSADALLSDAARAHAHERPFAPAVVDGNETWTWADLHRRAGSIQAALAARGFGPGDRLGLAAGPSALAIAALHGVPRAGVDVVLVHPRLTADEVAALLDDAGCRACIVDPAVSVALPPGVERLDLGDLAARVPTGRAARAPRAAPADAVDVIVPTSGTMARPKLALLPLDRLAASARAWNEALPDASGWLLSLGLAHVAGIGIASRAAAAGVPVVVASDVDALALLEAIRNAAERGTVVSHLSLVAAQMAGLLDTTGDAPPPGGVSAVILGGGPIPADLVARARAAGWPVLPSYGMTETASGVVTQALDGDPADVDTVGRPLPGVRLRLRGGEIQVRGPMVFAGYLDDPAATSVALTGDGWLRTGDLGRLTTDGRLRIDGRADGLIISGGENVSPAEVEAALATHPGVREVAVVGVHDPTWGHVPVALVVMEPGADPSDEALTAHARGRLARYKVPARIVRVPSLPHTSLGKVQRRDLPALVESGGPGS